MSSNFSSIILRAKMFSYEIQLQSFQMCCFLRIKVYIYLTVSCWLSPIITVSIKWMFSRSTNPVLSRIKHFTLSPDFTLSPVKLSNYWPIASTLYCQLKSSQFQSSSQVILLGKMSKTPWGVHFITFNLLLT